MSRGCYRVAIRTARGAFKSEVILFHHVTPTSAPVAGTALGWPRGRFDRESPRQGKRGDHVRWKEVTPHQSPARCGTMKRCRIWHISGQGLEHLGSRQVSGSPFSEYDTQGLSSFFSSGAGAGRRSSWLSRRRPPGRWSR